MLSVERRLDKYDDHYGQADEERGAAQRLPVREVESDMRQPRDDEQGGEPIHQTAGAFHDVRNDHRGCEGGKGLECVEVRGVGPRRHAFEVRRALARKLGIERPSRNTERDVGKQRSDENAPKGERHRIPPGDQVAGSSSWRVDAIDFR